jgi:hypothetical protein
MTRRRFILAAYSAAVVLGAAWWVFSNGLTAEERSLVGTWRINSASAMGDRIEFKSDRTCEWNAHTSHERNGAASSYSACWSIQDGRLFLDYEPNPFRRSLRPLGRRIEVTSAPLQIFAIEIVTANQLILFTGTHGNRQELLRDRSD